MTRSFLITIALKGKLVSAVSDGVYSNWRPAQLTAETFTLGRIHSGIPGSKTSKAQTVAAFIEEHHPSEYAALVAGMPESLEFGVNTIFADNRKPFIFLRWVRIWQGRAVRIDDQGFYAVHCQYELRHDATSGVNMADDAGMQNDVRATWKSAKVPSKSAQRILAEPPVEEEILNPKSTNVPSTSAVLDVEPVGKAARAARHAAGVKKGKE